MRECDSKQIAVLMKHRKQSICALPVIVVLLTLSCIFLWVLKFFVRIPVWLATTLIAVLALTAIDEVINIIHVNRKLRSKP